MSALAEALVAAQRRALSAMEKQYVAGYITVEEFTIWLGQVGMDDNVDAARLLSCLDVIRQYGAQLPAETRPNGAPAESAPPAKATEAQLARIRRDLQSHNLPVLAEQDAANLTKAQASNIIEAIASGTYDPTVYDVPF